jgi:hypothetical protein
MTLGGVKSPGALAWRVHLSTCMHTKGGLPSFTLNFQRVAHRLATTPAPVKLITQYIFMAPSLAEPLILPLPPTPILPIL